MHVSPFPPLVYPAQVHLVYFRHHSFYPENWLTLLRPCPDAYYTLQNKFLITLIELCPYNYQDLHCDGTNASRQTTANNCWSNFPDPHTYLGSSPTSLSPLPVFNFLTSYAISLCFPINNLQNKSLLLPLPHFRHQASLNCWPPHANPHTLSTRT